MKKLIISVSDEKFGKIRKSIGKVIRIGLGSITAFSFLFSVASSRVHASGYEELITKYTNKEEQVRLVTELNTCIWKATDGNSNIVEAIDRYDYCKYPERPLTEFTTEAVSRQLQRGKINIHNLDIYLLKNKNSKEEHWKLVKGSELFLINPAKYLLANSLEKLVNFIQGLLPERTRTQSFLFYSEVFIKVFILRLLINILQKGSSSDEERLEEELFEIFYNLLTSFLPWSYWIVGRLPPLSVQQMVFTHWVVLHTFIILIDAFLEKYLEKKVTKDNEEKGSFWKETLETKLIPELLYLTTAHYLAKWLWRWWLGIREDYPSDIHVSTTRSIESIGWVLFITNRLSSNMLKVIINLKNKLNEEINEKVL